MFRALILVQKILCPVRRNIMTYVVIYPICICTAVCIPSLIESKETLNPNFKKTCTLQIPFAHRSLSTTAPTYLQPNNNTLIFHIKITRIPSVCRFARSPQSLSWSANILVVPCRPSAAPPRCVDVLQMGKVLLCALSCNDY